MSIVNLIENIVNFRTYRTIAELQQQVYFLNFAVT